MLKAESHWLTAEIRERAATAKTLVGRPREKSPHIIVVHVNILHQNVRELFPGILIVMYHSIAIITILLLSACGQATRAPVSASSCATLQELPQGNLLLFGEMHGSIEAPALISQLACSLSKSEVVAVGLEYPSRDQPLIDAYLVSQGSTADVNKLTSTDFWQHGRDGRSSSAMLALIEDIRKLKAQGRAVALFAFDDQPDTNLERNVAIANGIRRFQDSHANAKIIALMGNIHAMQDPTTIGGIRLVPSGALLKDLKPVSVFVAYPAGTIWACDYFCGTQNVEAVNGLTGSSGFQTGSPMRGYTHTFLLSSITASLPAVQ